MEEIIQTLELPDLLCTFSIALLVLLLCGHLVLLQNLSAIFWQTQVMTYGWETAVETHTQEIILH